MQGSRAKEKQKEVKTSAERKEKKMKEATMWTPEEEKKNFAEGKPNKTKIGKQSPSKFNGEGDDAGGDQKR